MELSYETGTNVKGHLWHFTILLVDEEIEHRRSIIKTDKREKSSAKIPKDIMVKYKQLFYNNKFKIFASTIW